MFRPVSAALVPALAALLAACPADKPAPPRAKTRPGPAPKAGGPQPKDPMGKGHFEFENGRLPRSVPRTLTAAERRPWDRAITAAKNRGKLHTLFRPAISSAAFIKTIDIQPGDVIADIGCGTGALQIGLLEHKVPFTKMYAVDQQEAALALLNQMLEATKYPGWKKIQTLVPGRDITRLPDGALHKVLIVNVMQFIFDAKSRGIKKERQSILRFLTALRKALRPKGLLYNYKEMGTSDGVGRKDLGKKSHVEHEFKRLSYPLQSTGYEILRKETLDVDGFKYLLVVARVKD